MDFVLTQLAGFGTSVTLLEEPLAAFYSWLIHHEAGWQEFVKPDDLILVCDVGGLVGVLELTRVFGAAAPDSNCEL